MSDRRPPTTACSYGMDAPVRNGYNKHTMAQPRIPIPREELAEFCRRNQIQRLALFGSVLRDDFSPDSDVDVLVEFEPEAQIGFMALSRIQRELSELFGRNVDLVLRDGIKPIIRQAVIGSSQDVYAV